MAGVACLSFPRDRWGRDSFCLVFAAELCLWCFWEGRRGAAPFQICHSSTRSLSSLTNGIYPGNFISSGLNCRPFTVISTKVKFFIPPSEGSFRAGLSPAVPVEVTWSCGLHVFAVRKVPAPPWALPMPDEVWGKAWGPHALYGVEYGEYGVWSTGHWPEPPSGPYFSPLAVWRGLWEQVFALQELSHIGGQEHQPAGVMCCLYYSPWSFTVYLSKSVCNKWFSAHLYCCWPGLPCHPSPGEQGILLVSFPSAWWEMSTNACSPHCSKWHIWGENIAEAIFTIQLSQMLPLCPSACGCSQAFVCLPLSLPRLMVCGMPWKLPFFLMPNSGHWGLGEAAFRYT